MGQGETVFSEVLVIFGTVVRQCCRPRLETVGRDSDCQLPNQGQEDLGLGQRVSESSSKWLPGILG